MRLFEYGKSGKTEEVFNHVKNILKEMVSMKHEYISNLSVKECNRFISDNLDLIYFNYGLDRFRGWAKFGFFSITFAGGRKSIRNPIFSKAIGRITEKKGKTLVSIHTYKGLTDMFSVFQIFIAAFIFFGIVTQTFNIILLSFLSAISCCLASFITFLFAYSSEEGLDSEEELLHFLEISLNLKKND